MGGPVVVLIVASGASWEPRATSLLNAAAGVVVLRRCVDVDDLLATAAAGQADAAVVGLDAPGLDQPAVEHLRGHGLVSVAVVPDGSPLDAARARAARIGIGAVVAEAELERLPAAVVGAVSTPPPAPLEGSDPSQAEPLTEGAAREEGRIVAVWGPAGSPGRTTVAVGLAAELGRRGHPTVLVDADPHAASVAQQLGILDEVSGLLAAARLVSSGRLAERFATVQRGLGPRLGVVTGLPRPDRWAEVRPGALEELLAVARDHGQVVVDTGFSLEEEPATDLSGRGGRNQLTLGSLDAADEVVVVGAADPVGLARLARGLVELRERLPATPVRVVVNRMRPTLGWKEPEVAGMLGGFGPSAGVHFLPDDRAAADRALVTGRTLVESGDSALARALAEVVDALAGESGPRAREARRTRLRQRRAGRARRR